MWLLDLWAFPDRCPTRGSVVATAVHQPVSEQSSTQ